MCGLIFKEDAREDLKKKVNFSLDEWEFILKGEINGGFRTRQIK